MSDSEQHTIEALSREKGKADDSWEVFNLLQEHYFQEQAFFWQRFSAFSALHAGLLVLATSDSIAKPQWIHWFGVALSFIWVLVQWASLHYTDRTKPQYYKTSQMKQIERKPHWLFSNPKMSSTNFALWTAVGVLLLWLLMALKVIT